MLKNIRKKLFVKKAKPYRIPLSLFIAATFLFCVFFLVFSHWKYAAAPVIKTVSYQFDEKNAQVTNNLSLVPSEGKWLTIDIEMELKLLHVTRLHLKPDDCLESLEINGVVVDHPDIHFCDYSTQGPIFNLSDYVHAGTNTIHVRIQDHGGLSGIKISAAQRDPLFVLLNTALVGLVILYGVFVLYFIFRQIPPAEIWLPLAVGTALRILYFIATPYTLRGHDTGAHIDYIEYVAKYVRIPVANTGWEYHQAPLYYFVTGIWMRFGELFSWSQEQIMTHIHLFSLVMSVVTLVIGFWITHILFPQKNQSLQRFFSNGFFAVFPSLIFLSSRITNDVLYVPLGFLACALLLLWWKNGANVWWILLCFVVSLAFLTKVSGIVLIATVFLSLLCTKNTFVRKIQIAEIGVLLVVLLTAWYPVIRLVGESDSANTLQFGNTGMQDGLLVPSDLQNYIVFNPVQVVLHPHNNPWQDEERRMFFLEYFFRSAFFGEFSYPAILKILSQILIVLAMVTSVVLLIGLVREISKNIYKSLPIYILSFLLCLAAFAYRFSFSYAPNQDFRQSILLVMPLAYWLAFGMNKYPKYVSPWFMIVVQITTACFLITCALFVLALHFVSY